MKKIILAFTATTFAAIAAISNVAAQNEQSGAGSVAFNEGSGYEFTLSRFAAEEESKSATTASKVNMRAIKDFTKAFTGVTNASWFKTEDGGFIADFTTGSAKNSVAYDAKGRWNHTIIYYDEKDLPKDVRNEVKSNYYDFNILGAEEIHVENEIVYLVHIQDDKICKIIRVCDDGMDEIESLNKQ